MAGRTQPIVYKPTNVTKYADAYANRLDAAAAEAKKTTSGLGINVEKRCLIN